MERTEITRFTKAILLIEFLFVAYMLYVLTSSIYQSYQIDRHIAEFDAENKKIAMENKKLSDDYDYYTSEAYQQKILKQNFGLLNPGEQAIILPEGDANASFENGDDPTINKALKRWNSYSMPQKWWRYFFEAPRF